MTTLNDPDEGAWSHPDYNPATWALGYQQRQFGVADDPRPTGVSPQEVLQYADAPYPSIYSALANPPANMTTAINKALDPDYPAPAVTPNQ